MCGEWAVFNVLHSAGEWGCAVLIEFYIECNECEICGSSVSCFTETLDIIWWWFCVGNQCLMQVGLMFRLSDRHTVCLHVADLVERCLLCKCVDSLVTDFDHISAYRALCHWCCFCIPVGALCSDLSCPERHLLHSASRGDYVIPRSHNHETAQGLPDGSFPLNYALSRMALSIVWTYDGLGVPLSKFLLKGCYINPIDCHWSCAWRVHSM